MAISGDYANPVTVNGYACRNCTEVDQAKKHIDPAHPQDGPFGINARTKTTHGPAIRFSGTLQAPSLTDRGDASYAPGNLVNLSV